MRGFNPKQSREYVVADERSLPREKQTIFKIKSLTLSEAEELKNNIYLREEKDNRVQERFLLGSQERFTLEMGLVGWENFRDAAGNTIPFSITNLDYIPARYRAELAAEIRGEASLTEAEVKN